MKKRKATWILPLAAIALAGCANGEGWDVPWKQASCSGEFNTETTLFFGLSRPEGEVSEADWSAFQQSDVVPAFAEGFTVINGDGYWRTPETGKTVSEKSKILVRLHKGSTEELAAIETVIDAYKTKFNQESVLRMDSEVCTEF